MSNPVVTMDSPVGHFLVDIIIKVSQDEVCLLHYVIFESPGILNSRKEDLSKI
jgi:hypothetical protein